MEPKPLPYLAFARFCEGHARAAELVTTYTQEFGSLVYPAVCRNPTLWQKFKFLVKHMEISLKSLSENAPRGTRQGLLDDLLGEHLLNKARRDWARSELLNCPDTATLKAKYYTNV
jgi:hypothetical protein